MLSKMASSLGEPLFSYECTKNQTRVSYICILVDINITQEPLKEIEIIEPTGRKFTQKIHYDWEPLMYPKCSQIGHIFPKRK